MDAVMTICIDRGSGNAAHFQNFAAVWHILDQPIGPQHTKTLLIHVHIDGILRIKDVIEGHKDNACFFSAFDNGTKGCRVLGVDDNCIVSRVNEVIDGGDLCWHILAC